MSRVRSNLKIIPSMSKEQVQEFIAQGLAVHKERAELSEVFSQNLANKLGITVDDLRALSDTTKRH